MKVFIVYVHPEPQSYNGAMFRLAQETLQEAGHEVRVSDLYAMGFNPVAGAHDVTAPSQTDAYHMQAEQGFAAENETFAPDIVAEQDKLYWCDLVIFQFPLWWFGIPAMMKGWFDRVLAFGWAYSRSERFDSGRMHGRRALMSITTGGPAERFAEGNMFAPIEQLLYPITVGTFQYVGLRILEPFIAWSVPRVSGDERQAYLDRFRERLRGIENETPLPFHSIRNFPDPTGGTLYEPTTILDDLMAKRYSAEGVN